MPDDLVTAAVFGDLTQAQAVRLHLEAAGIPSFLADENVAGGLFHLATAIGGIKLQVPASRLDEALRVLDAGMAADPGATDWSDVDVGLPEDEEPVDGEGEEPAPVPAAGPTPAPVSDTPADEPSDREQAAEGLLRLGVFGLVFAPFLLVAVWRLLQVWLSDGRLDPAYLRKARIGTGMIVLAVLVWAAVFYPLFAGFPR